MKNRFISFFLAVALAASLLSPMSFSVSATEEQKGDGWGNWSDYVDESTIVSYPVSGGNLYFGQMNPEWVGEEFVDKSKIELLGADSTVTNVQIPEIVNGLTVSTISEWAFSGCTQLTSVSIPHTVGAVWGSCFEGCTNLKEICVAKGSSSCYTIDGVLYTKEFNQWTNQERYVLELYPAAKEGKHFDVPEGVTSIAYWAFGDAANLRSISIPESISDIQSTAFGDGHSNVNFTDIYYEGSEDQWEEILVGGEYGYDSIKSTLIHFDRYEPFAESIGSDCAWNTLYYDYIIQDKANTDYYDGWEWVTYELVYLDDDNIPELWITYQSWASGCRLVTVDDNAVAQELLSMGSLSYNERDNAFFHSGGKMDVYFDTVYKLEGGSLTTIAEGRSEVTWSNDGASHTNYYWNDSDVTEKEYTEKLNNLVDDSVIRKTSSEQSTLYSYDEILEYLVAIEANPGEDTIVMEYADSQALKDKYGVSSQEQFVSCLGDKIQTYPSNIYGIVSMVSVDINDDNADELIVLRVSKKDDNHEAQLISEVYKNNKKGISLSAAQTIYNISFCAATNIYLFYSDVLDKYCIMIDSYSSGSYTGVNSWSAKVFTVEENAIDEYNNWESVPFIGINVDFETELRTINAPYAKYCMEYDNRSDESCYKPLCEVEHVVFGDSSTYTTRNHKLKISNTSEIRQSIAANSGLVVYSDYTNLSIRRDSSITLSAGILTEGELTEDVSGITFQVGDTAILSVSATDIKGNCRCVKLKGLAEGTTTVVFSDTKTGGVAKVLVTVYDDNYLSYTLNSVPTQNIDKYPTNVYNVNGLYIDSYKYTVNDDQSATVSFDVYNTNYTYGVVEVFDENGNMKDAVLIEKMVSSNTSIKEAVWDNIGYLVRDIIDGDFLSYRQESGYSKKTSVSVKIPRNGYIKICTDPENSLIVGLVNAVDSLMSMASLTGDIKNFDVNSKEFSEKLTKKLLADQVYVELIKDGSDASKKLWKNVGKEIFITSESMGDFADTVAGNIDELKLGGIIADTATDFGWSVGENVFTDLAGPAGAALKVMFSIGKVENIIIQQNDLIQSTGVGSIYIQNQGGGFRACQQIKVKGDAEFTSDTALNVFSVNLDSKYLDIIKVFNPDIYEAMTQGITYTYNISLLKNGDETQPNGKVTVYIPIPENLKVLAHAGEWTGGVAGKVKIYRVEEDGNLTEMDVEIEDDCFVFSTDHFSLYTIVGYASDESVAQKQNRNGNTIIATIGFSAAVIVAVAVVIIIKKKKSK